MSYAAYLAASARFWAALTGMMLGGAVASATGRATASGRKWTAMILFATGACASFAAGIIFPADLGIATLASLYVGLGSAAFFGLAIRFPRAAGVPALLVISVVAVAGAAVMRPWVPVRGELVVAQVKVLSSDGEGLYLEVTRAEQPEELRVVRISGRSIAPVARTLEIADYLFFLGADRAVRSVSILPGPAEAGAVETALPPGSAWVIGRVPLLSPGELAAPPVDLGPLQSYAIVADRQGLSVRRVE